MLSRIYTGIVHSLLVLIIDLKFKFRFVMDFLLQNILLGAPIAFSSMATPLSLRQASSLGWWLACCMAISICIVHSSVPIQCVYNVLDLLGVYYSIHFNIALIDYLL